MSENPSENPLIPGTEIPTPSVVNPDDPQSPLTDDPGVSRPISPQPQPGSDPTGD